MVTDNREYYLNYATGEYIPLENGNRTVLNRNDPRVMAQNLQYKPDTNMNFNSALNRTGGIGFGDFKFFQNKEINLTPNQLNLLNERTGGKWGLLDKNQQIKLIESGQLDPLLNATTIGQADQAWSAIENNMNNSQWTKQDTLGAIGMGINAATSLYGIYNSHKQLGLAKKAFEEQSALNRANFKNQARNLNSQYRDQISGRGHVGMNTQARSALGRTYNQRKLSETY